MLKTSASKELSRCLSDIASYVEEARKRIISSVNAEMTTAYWKIGRRIFEEEQGGRERATYGEVLLKFLSNKLANAYGKGFSQTNLKYMRQFYLAYPDRIGHEICDQLYQNTFNPNLSWTHYRILMQESRQAVRSFYEIEAVKNHWSTSELERQMGSLLYERLAKSKDKKGVLALSKKGQIIQKPIDVFKDPIILEFLDIPESHRLVENKLEEALINQLQNFLLELGRGFAFVARQKRITLDGDHFYPDLVFYHMVLKCYVIADLKIQKLTHQDMGQMQMYVNYFDREICAKDDNPTIGLVLCAEKNSAVVEYTLGEAGKQIFASKYQFHLPTIKELESELNREINQLSIKEFSGLISKARKQAKKAAMTKDSLASAIKESRKKQ